MYRIKALVMVAVVAVLAVLVVPVMAQTAEEPAAPADWLSILEKTLMLVVQLAIPPLLALGLAEFSKWRQAQLAQGWYQEFEVIAARAVTAAEQLGLTGELGKIGQDKLKWAVDYVERSLEAYGIPLDVKQYVDVIAGMIEAEVQRQFPHLST